MRSVAVPMPSPAGTLGQALGPRGETACPWASWQPSGPCVPRSWAHSAHSCMGSAPCCPGRELG